MKKEKVAQGRIVDPCGLVFVFVFFLQIEAALVLVVLVINKTDD